MASATERLRLVKPATTDRVMVSDLNANFDKLDLAACLPVGSVYMNMGQDPVDPHELLGYGTWQRLEDVFLVARGPKHTQPSGDTDLHMHQNKDDGSPHDVVRNAGLIRSDTASSVQASDGSTVSLGGTQYGGRVIVAEEGFSGSLEPPYQPVWIWYRTA